MKSIIYKYPCPSHINHLRVPFGATALYVGPDPSGKVHVWLSCPVESVRSKETTVVVVHGVRLRLPFVAEGKRHIGTLLEGSLVTHYFIQGEPA